jgi:calcineurin-like phosphoesterase family protein
MAEVWFSSDPHLFHDDMWKSFLIRCEWCKGLGFEIYMDSEQPCRMCKKGLVPARPFSSTKEMHDCMISHHNDRVKTTDHWYCLGDVSLLRGSYDKHVVAAEVKKFNGHGRLILGNHDHFDARVYRDMFEKVRAFNKIDNLLFSHIPIDRNSIPKGCVNVHGHVHTNPSPEGPYINVCMEPLNYAPITLEQLKDEATKKLAS